MFFFETILRSNLLNIKIKTIFLSLQIKNGIYIYIRYSIKFDIFLKYNANEMN